ncbi:hypothetical protein [Hymenobacter sp. 102]|uniref:hypothetical protein n=1 Tax=Hymenobacter sp. 102 TaxID=3403152 RepID=UPI003CF740A8
MKISEETPHIRLSQYYCWLQFNIPPVGDSFKKATWKHLGLHSKCVRLLREIGFKVTKDPYYEKHFPRLSQCHRYGKWRELEVGIEISWKGIKFEFYQNVNFTNPNGGKYDFDKYAKMPYLCQKRFHYTVRRLQQLLTQEVPGLVVQQIDAPKVAEQALLQKYEESWHHHGVQTLADVQGQLKSYDLTHNSADRDKKQILCGQVKYYRDFDGRLRRGVVYWYLNSQWYVILHPTSCECVSASHLFDPTPEDFAVRRLKKGRIPEEKQKQLDLLNSLSLPALRKRLALMEKYHKQAA